MLGRPYGYGMPCGQPMNYGMCGSVVEPVQTNYLQKDSYVNVQHIQPVHTHVVNKVHYNHSYVPQYSCSESTEIDSCGCGCNTGCMYR